MIHIVDQYSFASAAIRPLFGGSGTHLYFSRIFCAFATLPCFKTSVQLMVKPLDLQCF
jgi:hypothetical protein